MQLLPFQRDLVVVVSSNVPDLQDVSRQRLALPYAQLHETVARAARAARHPVHVTFRRNGSLVEVRDAAADPRFARALPWPAHKFLAFRAVEPGGSRACTP